MTLENFASQMLLKSYLKIKIELQHVIKRASHGLGLEMIFISDTKAWGKETRNSLDKKKTKPREILYLTRL